MPPILLAFFIVVGAMTAPPAVKGIVSGVDPMMRSKLGKPEPVSYRTWTSSPRFEKPGVCTFTVFALVSRSRLTRLQVNGVEQLVDWSWSWDVDIPHGYRASGMKVDFIDPVTRAVLASREIAEECSELPSRSSVQ